MLGSNDFSATQQPDFDGKKAVTFNISPRGSFTTRATKMFLESKI